MDKMKFLRVAVVLLCLPLTAQFFTARAEGDGKPGQHEPAKFYDMVTGRFDTVDVATLTVILTNDYRG